jgi:phage regulator Rha-like protein
MTPLKTNKQNKEKQISSQRYTKSGGHITVNEYSVEKGKEIKRSLIQALEEC